MLTSCDLRSNRIGVEGAKALASALEVNAVLTTLDLSDNLNMTNYGRDMSAIISIAEALKVNRVLTYLK